jgi:hypothetical protein
MDFENIFYSVFFIWYFSVYGIPYHLFIGVRRIYQQISNTLHFIQNLNNNVIGEKLIEEYKHSKPRPNYEDKYLDEFRKMNSELILDEREEEIKEQKFKEFLNEMREEYTNKLDDIKKKLQENKVNIDKYEGKENEYCIIDSTNDMHSYLGETKEENLKALSDENDKLRLDFDNLNKQLETEEGQEEIIKLIDEKTNKFMMEQRLEKLKNSYVMEYTPLGNVLMFYDNDRKTFKFYSDSTIPYRYLEVVGRKYAKQFGCKQIFVDMEEEIKAAEEKWERERIEKEERTEKERIKKEEAIKNNEKPIETKKNVFAKFKSYNKEAGTGHVNTVAPPKNSIPHKLTEKQENQKVLLKERANRYTYEGKLANFGFIKKVDRKVIDKKYAMTFAYFKKNICKS